MQARILVVDDDPQVRDTLAEVFAARGCQVSMSGDGEEALSAIRSEAFDLVFLDYRIPKVDGMQVLREAVALQPELAVVLVTGEGSEGVAREAFKLGAFDYLVKPIRRIDDLEIIFRQAMERRTLRLENTRLKRQNDDLRTILDEKYSFRNIVGDTREMRAIFQMIDRVASTRSTVLITGESGTGKELIARALHYHSDRRDRAFVSVNCGALPDTLLEDELFGHVRGAFTDATRDREGLLAAAHTGTLFLDEIGELPLSLQAKLLRVLQSQEFRRIGDDADRRVDVRIITATNRDLDQLVAGGTFRQDLYYRINVFPMHLPPLRARPEDIALLVHHFVQKYRGRLARPIDGVSSAALARFAAYDFPGNVRELENKVHQAMVIAAGPLIEEHDVTLPAGRSAAMRVDIARPFRDLKQEVIDSFERSYLTELLREHRGNLARAARAAGMDRKNLWALVERHGLDRDQFKKP